MGHCLTDEVLRGIKTRFRNVFNTSGKSQMLGSCLAGKIVKRIRSHNDSQQIHVVMLGDNNLRRKSGKIDKEIKSLLNYVRRIVEEASNAKDCRIIICSLIPDPNPEIDSKFIQVDKAFQALKLGDKGIFLNLRPALTGPNGLLKEDCYIPGGIRFSAQGNIEVGRSIRTLLEDLVPEG
jgi:hypothetical protein